jgi:hypothetical protein
MALRPHFNALLITLVLLPATGLGRPADAQKCKLPWAVYNGGLDAIDELIASGLRRALSEFEIHYHQERPHQGVALYSESNMR